MVQFLTKLLIIIWSPGLFVKIADLKVEKFIMIRIIELFQQI